MKIALFMSTILEQGGGLEKYLIETANNLSTKGVQVDIITMDDDFTVKIANLLGIYYFRPQKSDIENIKKEPLTSITVRLGKAKYIKCKSFKELTYQFNEYDVIYSKNELLESFILKFIVGYNKIPPVIFGVHTPHYYPITKSFHSKLHNFLYCSIIYNYLASGVICFHVSNQQSYEVLSKQFSPDKVVKVFYPFDVQKFVQKKQQFVYKYKFNKDKYNIMWAGRITEQKGVNDLVQIIEDINKTTYENEVVWNIFGDGDQRDMVLALSKRWNNVNYHGHIENNYIADILSKNDLFISTSKWEVSPFNILEAQAMSLPVLAYNIAGPADIIENQKTGFLVDNIGDYIRILIMFIDKRTNIESSNYINKRVDLIYSTQKINKSMINLFEQVI